MDQTVLDMKYNELVKHAKDLGLTFTSSKPKKEQIIEMITEYHEDQAAATSSKSEGRRTRKPKVNYDESEEKPVKTKVKKVKSKTAEVGDDDETAHDEEEPKKKKVKKVKSKSPEDDEDATAQGEVKLKKKKSKKVSNEIGQDENSAMPGEAKLVKKKKKVKKDASVEPPPLPLPEEKENEPKTLDREEISPVKKVKKSTKIKANLKCTETDEMKRVRKSILEKKMAKINKSNKELAKSEESTGEDSAAAAADVDVAVESKKEKRIKFSEKDVGDLSGDASSSMKRRIINKKKKSSSPTLKPALIARRASDRLRKDVDEDQEKEAEKSLLAETNEIIEGQEICDDQFQLQLDSEDDSREAAVEQKQKESQAPKSETLPRRSIAFTIDATATTTEKEVKQCQPQKAEIVPRRSIAFTIDSATNSATPTRKSILTRPATAATTTPMSHMIAQRRSIAFTIETTPKSNQKTRPSIGAQPRKSIVIEVPVVPETNNDMMTDDEASIDKTYPIAPQVNSPMVTCKTFYKPNATLDISNDLDEEPEKKAEPTKTLPVAPMGRARIVRPTEVKKTVETVVERNKINEVVVKKVVEVVRREAGPRITKPTMPEAESNNSKKIPEKKVLNSNKPKPVIAAKKVPDFKAIHERNFNKSEDITEAGKRAINRHNQLLGSQTKSATTTTNSKTQIPTTGQETSMVSNLMSHATNLLKRITPFSSNEDTENNPNEAIKPTLAKTSAVTSNIPKIKIGIDKIERPPFLVTSLAPEREAFSTSLKPRTPLGTRTLNSMRTPSRNQQQQPTTPCHSKTTPKTPHSNNKPKTSSLLLSASKKPVLSKPFHFQNQNLESNINFGNACQFGTNTGKTPLKDSAFQRRKSYNPRDSIGRPLTYNPHQGRLKPLDSTKSTQPEDSLTVRAAAAIASQEKRKSMLGIQKNMEKEKLCAKRRQVRNTEMDRPRIL